ncbi:MULTISPECIES: carboxymuconolactone decarboxylase family protein [unclassified Bartonella]|uniref:carboxymuconolactone decarboxylase family protein n=1 Tax=unclassified Bartonella TaxID=2645622 RepID=UPI0035CE8805
MFFAAKEVFDEKQLDFISSCGSPLVCEDRYESGLKALEHIDGPDGQMIIKTLGSIAPDLARFVVEFGFGDIYTRHILNFFEREIITVAALGTAIPQLKLHIQGLLNVGGTPEQVIELAIHIAPYAGFPAAINVVEIAKEVFASRKET